MSVEAFLKALMRDVAWNFFYGIVNFDAVIGTMNHYGNVDLFAGRYNDAYRKAELDHQENFPDERDHRHVQGHARRLDQRRLRPVRRPAGDRLAVRREARRQPRGHHPHPGHRPAHGGRAGRRAAAHRRHRPPGQPHVRRRRPGRAGRRGRARLRGRGGGVQPVRLPVAQRRDVEPVGGVGVQGQPLLPDHRGVHPARSSTATTGSSGSSSCPTRSTGRSRTARPASPGPTW